MVDGMLFSRILSPGAYFKEDRITENTIKITSTMDQTWPETENGAWFPWKAFTYQTNGSDCYNGVLICRFSTGKKRNHYNLFWNFCFFSLPHSFSSVCKRLYCYIILLTHQRTAQVYSIISIWSWRNPMEAEKRLFSDHTKDSKWKAVEEKPK